MELYTKTVEVILKTGCLARNNEKRISLPAYYQLLPFLFSTRMAIIREQIRETFLLSHLVAFLNRFQSDNTEQASSKQTTDKE